MSVVAIGIDPGQHGAVAVVSATRGQRPTLLGVWWWWSKREHLWREQVGEALYTARSRQLEEWDQGRGPALGPAGVELPTTMAAPKGTRSGAVGLGLGRRVGRIQQQWHTLTGDELDTITPQAWWSSFRLRGKRGDGQHRTAEARLYVGGADARLAQVRESCRVDAAEAVLMAAHLALGAL